MAKNIYRTTILVDIVRDTPIEQLELDKIESTFLEPIMELMDSYTEVRGSTIVNLSSASERMKDSPEDLWPFLNNNEPYNPILPEYELDERSDGRIEVTFSDPIPYFQWDDMVDFVNNLIKEQFIQPNGEYKTEEDLNIDWRDDTTLWLGKRTD